jgi:hypothetical protein
MKFPVIFDSSCAGPKGKNILCAMTEILGVMVRQRSESVKAW